jgi:2-methylisocitrate lyase-like PEP mutase family enzyme
MDALNDQLIAQFERAGLAAFLFADSELSRRCQHFDDWSEFLKRLQCPIQTGGFTLPSG